MGKRVHRGLFQSSDGLRFNADVNGSYNIIRKVVPDAFQGKGIGGTAVHPCRLAIAV
jgi:transposase